MDQNREAVRVTGAGYSWTLIVYIYDDDVYICYIVVLYKTIDSPFLLGAHPSTGATILSAHIVNKSKRIKKRESNTKATRESTENDLKKKGTINWHDPFKWFPAKHAHTYKGTQRAAAYFYGHCRCCSTAESLYITEISHLRVCVCVWGAMNSGAARQQQWMSQWRKGRKADLSGGERRTDGRREKDRQHRRSWNLPFPQSHHDNAVRSAREDWNFPETDQSDFF